MANTPAHKVYYPAGNPSPNVPADMQKQAESTDAALSRISEAPFIVCEKTTDQTLPAGAEMSLITWDKEILKQGILHEKETPGDFIMLEDGIYTVNAKSSQATDYAAVVVFINGARRPNTYVDAARVSTAAAPVGPKPVTISEQKLTAGDVVQIRGTAGRLVPAEMSLSIKKSAGFTKK